MGKTTCAAALAVSAASRGLRTLIISSDPASSLGDAFGTPLTTTPRPIRLARGSLHAVELDAKTTMRRWLRARVRVLQEIAYRGTWLDRDDISQLLGLSLPGVDELAALLELLRYGRSGRYDRILVDSAPTGHTLRMLTMPAALGSLANLFDVMQAKHRAIVAALGGRWNEDEADALIEELHANAQELTRLLHDRARLEVWWVTLAEEMSVEETLDAADELLKHKVPLQNVVFNRLTPRPTSSCTWCNARRWVESRGVAAFRAGWDRRLRDRQTSVPRLIRVVDRYPAPVGIRALAAIGRELTAGAPPLQQTVGRARHSRAVLTHIQHSESVAHVPDSATCRLVMFGGKGGVGKTTCAAAAAIDIARRRRRTRLLLLSVDPAHSLSDALATRISDLPQPIAGAPPNLHVRELDARAAFTRIQTRYVEGLEALFGRIMRRSAIDTSHDRQVMRGLMDLAPPGLDEIAAVLEVVDLLAGGTSQTGSADSHSYELIVIDTAPTGHALRLLETPALVHEWTKAVMSVLLKYEGAIRMGTLGSLLVELSRALTRLQKLLVDPALTQFIVITRTDPLARGETARLMDKLRRMRLNVPAVIVNALGRGSCARCRRAAAAERRTVAAIVADARRGARTRAVIAAPAEVPPPRGPAALERWRAAWREI